MNRWTIRKRLIWLILVISIPFFLFPGYEFLVERGDPTRGLLFLAIGGLVAAISGFVFGQTIERPLRALARAARAVAGGDLTVRLPERPGDELGELAGDFNRMVATLEANRAEAERAYARSQARAQSLDTLAAELQRLHALSLSAIPGIRLGGPVHGLDDLLQNVATSCARLGYYGVSLYLIDETQKDLCLAAGAVGQPEMAARIHRAEEVSGLTVRDTRFPLDASDNLLVRCVQTGEPFRTPHLHDLAQPRMTAEVAQAAQQIAGITCMAGVPLQIEEHRLGVLAVSVAQGVIGDDDLETLSRFATQAAIAIASARLAEAERTTRQNLAALADISDPALATLPLNQLLRALIGRLVQAVGATVGAILLVDNHRLTSVSAEVWPVGSELTRSLAERSIAEGRPVMSVASDAVSSGLLSSPAEGGDGDGGWALLAAPLVLGERTIGAALVGAPRPHMFAQAEAERLQLIAQRAALAIENARLQEERQRRLQELALLHEATMALSQSLQRERLADALAGVLERLLPYDRAEVLLIHEATGELIPFLMQERRQGRSEPVTPSPQSVRLLGQGITGWVAEHNQPVRLSDVTRETDPPYVAQHPGIRSILCVPLHIGKWAVGAIKLESAEPDMYGEHHERLLMALAGQLAVAIENARLFSEIGERVAELAHRNLDLAALLNLSQSLTVTLDPDTLYEVVLRQAVAAIAPAAGGMLWIYNPQEEVLELAGVHGYNLESRASPIVSVLQRRAERKRIGRMGLAKRARLHPGEATVGEVYVRGAPLHLRTPAEFEPYMGTAGAEALRLWNEMGQQARGLPLATLFSQIVVPLAVQGNVIGCLNLDTFGEPAFSEADLSLLQAIANQAAVAIENARLFAAITESREQLRALSAQIIQAQEEERRRLARELHDEIGQALTAVTLDLGLVAQLMPLMDERLQRAIDDAQMLSQNALEQVRRLSVELRPSILDDLGLVPALRWYIDRYIERTGVQSRFEVAGLNGRLPGEIETVCYRTVQEALTNIARHAAAGNVSVYLEGERDGEAVILTISDDGVGFDVNQALHRARAGSSLGLLGLRERVELLGGTLSIRSRPGRGTTIEIRLPVNG